MNVSEWSGCDEAKFGNCSIKVLANRACAGNTCKSSDSVRQEGWADSVDGAYSAAHSIRARSTVSDEVVDQEKEAGASSEGGDRLGYNSLKETRLLHKVDFQ